MDGISLKDINNYCRWSKGFDKDFQPASKPKDEVKSAFFLNIVVTNCSVILKPFSCKNESLLIGWNSFFCKDFLFYCSNVISVFNVQSNGFSCECSYEYLHSSPESEDKVDCAFLLDVVVSKSTLVFELLSCKNESLLIDWDSFFVCNQSFEVGNSLASLNFACHCLSCECLYEYLHVLFMIMNLIPFPPYLSISSNYY